MGDLYLVVAIENQGFGKMRQSDYAALPRNVLGRVDVLAVCETDQKAKFITDCLPTDWRDVTLAWWGDCEAAEPLDFAAALGRETIADGDTLVGGETIVIREG